MDKKIVLGLFLCLIAWQWTVSEQQVRIRPGETVLIGPSPGQIQGPVEVPKTAVQSCTNSGRGGSKTKSVDCMCAMGCDPRDAHGAGAGLGARDRCKTYCRQHDCKCKLPCL